jgi:hypothetical protein
MVVGWSQISGTNPEVCYGKEDFGTNADRYPLVHQPDRQDVYLGMTNCFARLENLQPGTPYYFVVRDSSGTSSRYWFRTAPDQPQPFTMIAGGDSRQDYDQSESIRAARCAGNKLVATLRPLFVLYGGDYVFKEDAIRWEKWLEDWQLTITEDGRIPPILPVHGNHENYDFGVLSHIFDTKNPDQYCARSFGGDLMRVWILNSEIEKSGTDPAAQNTWLENDLIEHKNTTWKMAAYHKPMRPHTIHKVEGEKQKIWWADLFYKYGMDLAAESDSHLCKRTYPIRPSDGPKSTEGFIRDDQHGTVYIGEGSWAAPMKQADDLKSWTMAAGKVNQFKWIKVAPKALEIRSVLFKNVDQVTPLTEDNLFEEPKGMIFWEPESGRVLRLPFDPNDPEYSAPPQWETLFPLRSAWDWSLDGKTWNQGIAPLGYGDNKVKTQVAPDGQRPQMVIFRKQFCIDTDPQQIKRLQLQVKVDDGCAIFLNSKEVFRHNLPKGELSPNTRAIEQIGGKKEDWIHPCTINPTFLKQGENILRVQVYQFSPQSSDVLFDSRLEIVT